MADLVIDEEALKRASEEFRELRRKTNGLYRDLRKLDDEFAEGFKTPAGQKFRNSYHFGLLNPVAEQLIVIDHISENLDNARDTYQSIFDDYRNIVRQINSDD